MGKSLHSFLEFSEIILSRYINKAMYILSLSFCLSKILNLEVGHI